MTEWKKDKSQQGLYQRSRDDGAVWAVKARVKGGPPITVTIGKVSLFSPPKARTLAKKILADLAQGINPNQEVKRKQEVEKARSLTLKDAVTKYSEIASWKPKTKDDALSTIKRWFSAWYDKPLAEITKRDVELRFQYIKGKVAHNKAVRDKKRKANNLPIKTFINEPGTGEAQRAIRYLSAVFNSYIEDDAGDEKLLPKGNPCDVIKTKKLRKTLRPRETFLNEQQRASLYDLLASATGSPDYPGSITKDDADLIWLLIHTGLRLDEARTLTWDAVDLLRQRFTAYNTKNHTNHTLPMTNATKSMFERRYESRGRSKYVFPSPILRDRNMRPMSASRSFERVCAEVGFTFSAHDLRRTVATVAYENGYDINAIGQVLNHSKAGVTAQYIQHTEKKLKEVLIDIQNALFPIPTEDE